jgi:hypothetical protein
MRWPVVVSLLGPESRIRPLAAAPVQPRNIAGDLEPVSY